MAILKSLQDIVSTFMIELSQSPIIENNEVRFSHGGHDVSVATVAFGSGHLLQ